MMCDVKVAGAENKPYDLPTRRTRAWSFSKILRWIRHSQRAFSYLSEISMILIKTSKKVAAKSKNKTINQLQSLISESIRIFGQDNWHRRLCSRKVQRALRKSNQRRLIRVKVRSDRLRIAAKSKRSPLCSKTPPVHRVKHSKLNHTVWNNNNRSLPKRWLRRALKPSRASLCQRFSCSPRSKLRKSALTRMDKISQKSLRKRPRAPHPIRREMNYFN